MSFNGFRGAGRSVYTLFWGFEVPLFFSRVIVDTAGSIMTCQEIAGGLILLSLCCPFFRPCVPFLLGLVSIRMRRCYRVVVASIILSIISLFFDPPHHHLRYLRYNAIYNRRTGARPSTPSSVTKIPSTPSPRRSPPSARNCLTRTRRRSNPVSNNLTGRSSRANSNLSTRRKP